MAELNKFTRFQQMNPFDPEQDIEDEKEDKQPKIDRYARVSLSEFQGSGILDKYMGDSSDDDSYCPVEPPRVKRIQEPEFSDLFAELSMPVLHQEIDPEHDKKVKKLKKQNQRRRKKHPKQKKIQSSNLKDGSGTLKSFMKVMRTPRSPMRRRKTLRNSKPIVNLLRNDAERNGSKESRNGRSKESRKVSKESRNGSKDSRNIGKGSIESRNPRNTQRRKLSVESNTSKSSFRLFSPRQKKKTKETNDGANRGVSVGQGGRRKRIKKVKTMREENSAFTLLLPSDQKSKEESGFLSLHLDKLEEENERDSIASRRKFKVRSFADVSGSLGDFSSVGDERSKKSNSAPGKINPRLVKGKKLHYPNDQSFLSLI